VKIAFAFAENIAPEKLASFENIAPEKLALSEKLG
jgi:hypothetical protein